MLAQPAAAAETAPVYKVTQEGMTADEGAKLAEAYRIPNALQENGAFGYVSEEFAKVPTRQVATGKDEAGRRTDSESLDTRALARLKPIGAEDALERASWLTELLGKLDLELNPKVSHAKLTLSDRAGKPTNEYALDTTVSHDLTLGGLPATGQGAKLRITFAPDGTVTQLSSSLRKLEKAGEEPIIPSDEARKACEQLYDKGVQPGRADARLPAARARRRRDDLPQLHLQPVERARPAGAPAGPGDRGHRPEGQDRGQPQRREDPRRGRR